MLFNAFHDILPGSSIERAYTDQIAQVGGVFYSAQRYETQALLDLAQKIDTRPVGWNVAEHAPQPVPVLVWNPHPRPLRASIEIEVALDYRPLWDYKTRPTEVPVAVSSETGISLPRQLIGEEHDSFDVPWRRRVVLSLDLPPLGWRVLQMGLATTMPVFKHKSPVAALGQHGITNGRLSVIAEPGTAAVKFKRGKKVWLEEGLQVRVYDDPWGSWGGMLEEPDSYLLPDERERWKIEQSLLIETGPERSALWVRFAGKNSRLDLTFQLVRGALHVKVLARVFWNERRARLRLVLPTGGAATYDVPGGEARRDPCGEVPGGRFVCLGRSANRLGFASDALYSFSTTATEFYATVVRASRYCSDPVSRPEDRPWLPAVDAGELLFNFLLSSDLAAIPALAAELEEPPVVMCVPAWAGPLKATGSTMACLTPELKILSLVNQGRAFGLRLQNIANVQVDAAISWLGQHLALGSVGPWEIATWKIEQLSGRWSGRRTEATQTPDGKPRKRPDRAKAPSRRRKH
jgi:alpha-mannosidase